MLFPTPLIFRDREALKRALDGVDVLYNTYWVRFSKKGFSQKQAVQNTLELFKLAGETGIGRIVHISITNPSEASPYEYFREKAVMERELMASGQACSILRPAVIFGGEDILVNNICWILRHLPIFGIFGDGRYKIQPIQHFLSLQYLPLTYDQKPCHLERWRRMSLLPSFQA